jgi:uncharacterized protein (TIGR00730 family)
MNSNHNLCVYCGSGPGRNPAYLDAARTLGRSLAASRIGLVYGGGSLGLMGEVARAALSAGGRVIGIIPEFLVQREQMLTEVQEVIVTSNMHERKMSMFEKADGFVALPGGIGTLEELVEISTWAQLNQHRKPIIIANIENYWDPLLALVQHMRQENFIRPGLEVKYEVVDRAEEIVPVFLRRAQALGPPPSEIRAVRSHA